MAGKPYVVSLAVQLLFCCALMSVSAESVTPAPAPPEPLKWDVEYIMWAPDCNQSVVIGINGKFPGPNISANAGDMIEVEVTNKLHTEGVVIHWHGIRQTGTPWYDGTASISQCPINPGETFTYNFTVDKPGTHFYHGHYGMQRAAGLYGSLIVHATDQQPELFADQYDKGQELTMLLSDWYHENVYAQAAGLDGKGKHWQWVGEPQTILINGRGQFGCSLGGLGPTGGEMETCDPKEKGPSCKEGDDDYDKEPCERVRRSECGPFCENSTCSPVVFDVKPDTRYRLRIASTTSLSALNVQVQGHKLTMVEADGNSVGPLPDLDDIDIYSGESYSVVLHTKKDPEWSSYWITVGVRGRHPKTPPALAILRYTNSNPANSWPKDPPPQTPDWEDVKRSKEFTKRIKAGDGTPKPPEKGAKYRRITLLNTQNELKDGQVKWAINHVTLSLPAIPYLGAYFYGIQDKVFDTSALPDADGVPGYDIEKPPSEQEASPDDATTVRVSDRVFTINDGDIVDVVLQNADMLRDDVSEVHPWHLHGHDFWVLGYGEGAYPGDAADDKAYPDAPLRNTVVLFPHGWTLIRFQANNTGVWAFHCHIEPHLHMGMGVIFAEGNLKALDVPTEASEAITCGMAKTAQPLAPVVTSPP